jgi:hypothetical protein
MREWIAAVLSLVILISASARARPWQFDVETSTHWLTQGALRAAALNGFTLGAAVFSRLGFWLAWVLPVAMFAGGPLGSLLAASVYGVVRLGLSSALALPPYSRLIPTSATAARLAAVVMYAVIAYLIAAVVFADPS